MLEPQYANRICPGGNGIFYPTIVINGHVVGTWKRTFKKNAVVIETDPFTALSDTERADFAAAAQRFADYLQLPILFADMSL